MRKTYLSSVFSVLTGALKKHKRYCSNENLINILIFILQVACCVVYWNYLNLLKINLSDTLLLCFLRLIVAFWFCSAMRLCITKTILGHTFLLLTHKHTVLLFPRYLGQSLHPWHKRIIYRKLTAVSMRTESRIATFNCIQDTYHIKGST